MNKHLEKCNPDDPCENCLESSQYKDCNCGVGHIPGVHSAHAPNCIRYSCPQTGEKCACRKKISNLIHSPNRCVSENGELQVIENPREEKTADAIPLPSGEEKREWHDNGCLACEKGSDFCNCNLKSSSPKEDKCESRGQHCYDKGTGHSCTVCCFCKMSYFWGEKVPSPTVLEEWESIFFRVYGEPLIKIFKDAYKGEHPETTNIPFESCMDFINMMRSFIQSLLSSRFQEGYDKGTNVWLKHQDLFQKGAEQERERIRKMVEEQISEYKHSTRPEVLALQDLLSKLNSK